MTADDVTSLFYEAVMSCRGTRDLMLVEQRLGLAEHFLPTLAYSGLSPVAAPGPAAAVGRFLGLCQPDRQTWQWCRRLLAGEGLDADRLVNEAAALVHPGMVGSYGSPVQNFETDPAVYRLVDVAALPFPHTLYSCGLEPAYRNERRRLDLRRRARTAVGLPSPRTDNAAWRRIQQRVVSGKLPACPRHDIPTAAEWARLATAATSLRNSVRPWTEDALRTELHNKHVLEADSAFARVLMSLFSQPVQWNGQSNTVTNGQHRICGARLAGSQSLLVAVR